MFRYINSLQFWNETYDVICFLGFCLTYPKCTILYNPSTFPNKSEKEFVIATVALRYANGDSMPSCCWHILIELRAARNVEMKGCQLFQTAILPLLCGT